MRVGPVVLVQDAVPREAVRHHSTLRGARLGGREEEEEVIISKRSLKRETTGILHQKRSYNYCENILIFFFKQKKPEIGSRERAPVARSHVREGSRVRSDRH